MKTRYRIVTDRYAGYEAQIKRWWHPFWMQIEVNSRQTVEESEAFIKAQVKLSKQKTGQFVKYVEVD